MVIVDVAGKLLLELEETCVWVEDDWNEMVDVATDVLDELKGVEELLADETGELESVTVDVFGKVDEECTPEEEE